MRKNMRLSIPFRRLLILMVVALFVAIGIARYRSVRQSMRKMQVRIAAYDALIVAVKHDDIPAIKNLTAYGADVNAVYTEIDHINAYGWSVQYDYDYGRPLLVTAAAYAHTDTSRLLLELGANPNSFSHDGWIPLTMAISERRIDIVRLLLQWGADPNLNGTYAVSPGNESTPMKEARHSSRIYKDTPNEREDMRKLIAILKEAGARE